MGSSLIWQHTPEELLAFLPLLHFLFENFEALYQLELYAEVSFVRLALCFLQS